MANNVSVTAWFNTGFNAVNIPADPNGAWASEIHSETFPALNILQHTNLSSVKIKATFPQVVDIDYIRLDPPYTVGERPAHGGNATAFRYAYYFVTGVTMANGDTAILSLLPDYVNTAGGWNKLEIIDGITNRLTIKKSDDVYGRFTQGDPYLAPSETLRLIDNEIDPADDGEDIVYIESTVDLGTMAFVTDSQEYQVATSSVVVPKTYANFHAPTKYSYSQNPEDVDPERIYGKGNKTVVYDMDFTTDQAQIMAQGIENVRALGIENALLNTAVIPSKMVIQRTGAMMINSDTKKVSVIENDEQGQPLIYTHDVAYVDTNSDIWKTTTLPPGYTDTRRWYVCRELMGKWETIGTNIHLIYSDEVENKRVLYSEYNKVGIITNAGNRIEANPEEVYNNHDLLQVVVVSDPHLNGKPYYRFRYLHGHDGAIMGQHFFTDAVSGMQWKQIPLLYTEKSGNRLDQENFNASRWVSNLGHTYDIAQQKMALQHSANAMKRRIGRTLEEGVVDAATAGIMTSLPVSGQLFGAPQAVQLASNAVKNTIGLSYEYQDYQDKVEATNLQNERDNALYVQQSIAEKRQFLQNQNVVAPMIEFPYQNEGFRDFFGERFIVYQYRPTTRDLQRMDKILNMYGYAVTMPFDKDIINNRNHFVYVEANISVGGDIPRWLSEGVAMQISNGVRLWKVRPDNSYYERGGNV